MESGAGHCWWLSVPEHCHHWWGRRDENLWEADPPAHAEVHEPVTKMLFIKAAVIILKMCFLDCLRLDN